MSCVPQSVMCAVALQEIFTNTSATWGREQKFPIGNKRDRGGRGPGHIRERNVRKRQARFLVSFCTFLENHQTKSVKDFCSYVCATCWSHLTFCCSKVLLWHVNVTKLSVFRRLSLGSIENGLRQGLSDLPMKHPAACRAFASMTLAML